MEAGQGNAMDPRPERRDRTMKFQYTEKKVSLPTNVHAYAEK